MNRAIGVIINSSKFGKEEETFIKISKKMSIPIIFFNASERISYNKIKKKAKKCGIIYQNTSEAIALEIAKTLEFLGKRVVDPSKVVYNSEDKWMFYVLCKKNKIPVPKTILLSDSINSVKKQLKYFDKWPVVLKRIFGERGTYVDLAKTPKEAMEKIKKLWKAGNERAPIIAQEYIKSNSYRITFIGNKIVQTAIKKSNGWKCTGCYAENFGKFKIYPKLEKTIQKLIRITHIQVGGIDLLKKGNAWKLLEINSEPSFDFFECENEKIVEELFIFLEKEAEKEKILL
jgi:RimK family alpha-L-glutamate ligase